MSQSRSPGPRVPKSRRRCRFKSQTRGFPLGIQVLQTFPSPKIQSHIIFQVLRYVDLYVSRSPDLFLCLGFQIYRSLALQLLKDPGQRSNSKVPNFSYYQKKLCPSAGADQSPSFEIPGSQTFKTLCSQISRCACLKTHRYPDSQGTGFIDQVSSLQISGIQVLMSLDF